MRTPPIEAVLIGLAFILLGPTIVYGGIKMGSGPPMVLIGAGCFLGGLALGLSGLVRWLIGRFRRG